MLGRALLVAQLLGVLYTARSAEELWLIGYGILSGPAYGVSMRKGADTLVDEINRNPNLLPGYTLRIAWQDTRCSPARARSMVLRNLFNDEYVMFAPGAETSELDLDHDGTMSEAETETFQEVWNVSRLAGGPLGILGPTCSGAAMQIIPIAYRARLPMVSGSTTFPGLSDRTKFPNFYRTVLPDQSLSLSFIRLTKLLGHSDIVVITGTDSAWADQAGAIARIADSEGVTMNGIDFSAEIPLFKGYRVASPASIQLAVSQVVELKKRIISLMLYDPEVRHVLCFTSKAHFTTGVYMAFGWLGNALWTTAGDTTCTASEITNQVQKAFVVTSMEYWRSDDSTAHSCTDNVAVSDFQQKWWASMNRAPGDRRQHEDGYALLDEGGSFADALCFLALALHDALFNKGFTVDDLRARTQAVYDAEQSYLETLAFEGTSGRIQFQPGVAEPTAGMTIKQVVGDNFDAVASYNNGQLTFLPGKSLTFALPGETFDACSLTSCAPGTLQQYNECPNAGEVLNFSSNACGGCPTGSSYVVSGCVCNPGYYGIGSICQPCEAGTFSKSPGQRSCEQCPTGQFSTPPAQSCTYCEEGRYANATGMAVCTECPLHQTTSDVGSTSQSSCDCSDGYYFADSLQGCSKCPNSSRTAQPFASHTISSCLCREDFFMNSDFECQQCPLGSSTLGDGKVSIKSCLCEEGFYMPVDYSRGCQACPTVNECPRGSNEANQQFLTVPRSNRTMEQRYLDLAPRYWSTRENPMEVFYCGSKERCPGGRSPGNGCADGLVGIACEHCDTGFYWDGQSCERCMGYQTSAFVFPVLPLLICSFTISTMYRFLGDPINRFGSWLNTSWALFFVVVNYIQVLGSMGQLNMGIPDFMQEQLNVFSVLGTIGSTFFYECFRIRGIVGAQAVRGLYPIAVVIAAAVAWAGSVLVAKVLARPDLMMETNRTLNTVGSLFFYFYFALAGISLMTFQCADNPKPAPATLSADLSVVCWTSNAWKDAVRIGVVCFLIYCIGLSGLWGKAIWDAPKYYQDENWRERWKFLFLKWEAGRYGWSICYMLRNLLFNLVPCLFTTEATVLYLTMTIITVYDAGIILKMPFRTLLANRFEILTGFCAFTVISLISWWSDRSTSVLESRDSLTTLAISISFFPVALLPVGLLWVFFNGKGGKPTPAALTAAEAKFEALRRSLCEFLKMPSELGEVVMLNLEEPAVSTLKHAAFLITTDVLHRGSRRRLAGGSTGGSTRAGSFRKEEDQSSETAEAAQSPPQEKRIRIDRL